MTGEVLFFDAEEYLSLRVTDRENKFKDLFMKLENSAKLIVYVTHKVWENQECHRYMYEVLDGIDAWDAYKPLMRIRNDWIKRK